MSKTQSAIAKLLAALLAGGLLVAMAAVLMLNAVPVKAWNETPPCKDFMTGGGFITPSNNGAHANFGMGGSCKPGGDGHGLWGHLEYVDHGSGIRSSPTVPLPFTVHWLTITGYFQAFVCAEPDGTAWPGPSSSLFLSDDYGPSPLTGWIRGRFAQKEAEAPKRFFLPARSRALQNHLPLFPASTRASVSRRPRASQRLSLPPA